VTAHKELLDDLERAGIGFELVQHPRTMSAGEEAAVLDVPPTQVAKTLVLAGGSGYVRAVLPASERLDLHKVRELFGEGKARRLATEVEIAAVYPMFELGAVPPFGGPSGDRTIVDGRLVEQDAVVLEAGSHDVSLRLAPSGLLSFTNATVADICAD
jgi:prolyl-tRNA editing enzyme YbaK/EbsC (Cys-tRNA(Pro) deacylase)